MKSDKELALELENEYKKQAAKEIAEFKNNKRSSCLMKVHYVQGNDEYNNRNDNDIPWFPPVIREKKRS